MARKLIPQHAPDAAIIYVPEDDDAWDTARLESERARMAAAGESPDLHPVTRYQSGQTRFDIDAPGQVLGQVVTPRQYLDESRRPWRFRLRRLGPQEYDDVQALIEKGDARHAFSLACRVGLDSVENAPVTLQGGAGRPLSQSDVQWLHDQGLRRGIGAAVWLASVPLTDAEKKH